MIALILHFHSPGGLGQTVVALLLAALVVWVVFFVLPLPQFWRTVLAVIVAVALILMLLPGCATPQLAQARKDFLDSTDVSLGVEYNGVRASDTITNGRRKVALDVDAKQIQRLQSK